MRKHEKGQIVVILAVSMIAILAITALAVDGSMIYRERRSDQTVADSTALSAAKTASASTTCAAARTAAINQAISFAASQGVTLVNNTTNPNRVEATCSADNTKLDIKITVTSVAPTTFAKMVSRNELTTSVNTTSRVTIGGGTTYANGNGVWTTGTTCDANGGVWLYGAAYIKITGGGAYSASCISVDSSTSYVLSDGPIYYSGRTGTNVTTTTVGSKVVYLGQKSTYGSNGIMLANWQKSFALYFPSLTVPSYQYQVNPSINTAIPEVQWPTYLATIPTLTPIPAMTPPSCSGLTDYGSTVPSTATSYQPGRYNSINVRPGSAATFAAGVYCIKAGGSVDFGSDHNITANNVIFYFQGAGDFKTSGASTKIMTMNNSSIYLTNGNFDHQQATFKGEPISIFILQGHFYIQNGAYGSTFTAPASGLLLNMPSTNTGTFNILNGGLGAHKLTGTIYAPNALATISGGTSTAAIDCQLIVKRLEMAGSGVITLDTNNGNLYTSGGSTSIELLK